MAVPHLDPIARARALVLRMKLELRSNALTPERARQQLDALEVALVSAAADQTFDFPETVELTDRAHAYLARASVPPAARDPDLGRTPGRSYGRLFVIDGDRA